MGLAVCVLLYCSHILHSIELPHLASPLNFGGLQASVLRKSSLRVANEENSRYKARHHPKAKSAGELCFHNNLADFMWFLCQLIAVNIVSLWVSIQSEIMELLLNYGFSALNAVSRNGVGKTEKTTSRGSRLVFP